MVHSKKKIILISPTSDDFRKPLAEGQSGFFFPPMGLMLVAQTLKNSGYDVDVFDGNFDPDYKDKILKAHVTLFLIYFINIILFF